jgi:hypothetical protein
MNQDLERELRMLGIMIPTEDEVNIEEDLRTLHLSKDYYNRPELDLNGEPPW